MGTGKQKTCPVCKMQRATAKTGTMKQHNRWDGTKMVLCKGSGRMPGGLLRKLLS